MDECSKSLEVWEGTREFETGLGVAGGDSTALWGDLNLCGDETPLLTI